MTSQYEKDVSSRMANQKKQEVNNNYDEDDNDNCIKRKKKQPIERRNNHKRGRQGRRFDNKKKKDKNKDPHVLRPIEWYGKFFITERKRHRPCCDLKTC
jgi:hypothetical protein